MSLLFYIFSLLTMQMKLLNLVFSSIIVQFLLHQTGHCIHFVCMYFPLLLNHNFLDRNLLNFFRIYIHHNFINRDKTSNRVGCKVVLPGRVWSSCFIHLQYRFGKKGVKLSNNKLLSFNNPSPFFDWESAARCWVFYSLHENRSRKCQHYNTRALQYNFKRIIPGQETE